MSIPPGMNPDDRPKGLILPADFGKSVVDTKEIVDIPGTKKKDIARAVGNALQTIDAVAKRERTSPLLNHPVCGFTITCLSKEAAEIIRMVIQDASKAFPHLRIKPWEMHRYKPACRAQFLGRHYVTLAIVAGPNARPSFGGWQLGGPE